MKMNVRFESTNEASFNLELNQIPSSGESLQVGGDELRVISVTHIEQPNPLSAIILCEKERSGVNFLDLDWS